MDILRLFGLHPFKDTASPRRGLYPLSSLSPLTGARDCRGKLCASRWSLIEAIHANGSTIEIGE